MAQITDESVKDLLAGSSTAPAWTQAQINTYNTKLVELQQFRSYSYHHILLVSNTTIAADYLFDGSTTGSNALDRFLHASYTDKYSAQSVSSNPSDGQYMVLINGMTDAQFLIDSVNWELILIPDAGESNPHSSFVEGTMVIKEPLGVQFMNLLKTACDTLGSDPIGLTFILKTVFVGYGDSLSGGESIKQIIDVNPFTFTIMDIQAEFTSSGSEYTIPFVGNTNGISRMPCYGVMQQTGISASGTIGAALSNLETKLNQASKQSYTELIPQLSEANNTSAATANLTAAQKSPTGRLLQYQIIVDPSFANMAMDNVNGRLFDASANAALGSPQSIDIDSVITDIMLCSKQLMQNHNANIKDGYKNVFKIESAITSNLTTVTITYNVKPCIIPVLVKNNSTNAGTIINPNIKGRPVVEFEYVYTGLNTEVIVYDMKMMMGLAYYQTFKSTSAIPGGFKGASGAIDTISGGPNTVINTTTNIMRPYTPVCVSAQIGDPNANNKPQVAATAAFRLSMARWAFYESVSTTMTIAGIPQFLDGFNLRTTDVIDGTVAQAQTVPMITVKVKMPNDTQLFTSGAANYADNFWYDGKFNIISVKNNFQDGKFEQQLMLNAIPYDEIPGVSGDTSTSSSPSIPPATANQTKPQNNKSASTATITANTTIPTHTPEQKAKHGDAPSTVAPDATYDCTTMLQQKFATLADCKKVRLSQSFTLDQFIRRDINVTNDQRILTNLCKIANEMEKVKAWFGTSVIITSGYRSPAFNHSVKGASSTSDHMKGLACDVQFIGISPQDAWNKLKTSPFKFRQCIWEHFGNSSWVHCAFDVDPGYPKQNTATFFTLS